MVVKKQKMAVVGDTASTPDSFICGWKYETQDTVPLATRKVVEEQCPHL